MSGGGGSGGVHGQRGPSPHGWIGRALDCDVCFRGRNLCLARRAGDWFERECRDTRARAGGGWYAPVIGGLGQVGRALPGTARRASWARRFQWRTRTELKGKRSDDFIVGRPKFKLWSEQVLHLRGKVHVAFGELKGGVNAHIHLYARLFEFKDELLFIWAFGELNRGVKIYMGVFWVKSRDRRFPTRSFCRHKRHGRKKNPSRACVRG